MRRAILVSDEMREFAAFKAAGREIDAARWKGSDRSAKRKIEVLIAKLAENPSEQTFECFIEMHQRWGLLVDVFKYLENLTWLIWEDRIEIIWQKFGRDPESCQLIQSVYSSMREIDPAHCGLFAKERLRALITTVVECERHYPLRHELLQLIGDRYSNVMNVGRYVRNSFNRRYSRPKVEPLSRDEIHRLFTQAKVSAGRLFGTKYYLKAKHSFPVADNAGAMAFRAEFRSDSLHGVLSLSGSSLQSGT